MTTIPFRPLAVSVVLALLGGLAHAQDPGDVTGPDVDERVLGAWRSVDDPDAAWLFEAHRAARPGGAQPTFFRKDGGPLPLHFPDGRSFEP